VSHDTDELWSSARCAEYLGLAHARDATTVLRRLGVQPVSRQPGRRGQNLYLPAEVKAAHAARPGQGARTDLRRQPRQEAP